MRTLKKILCAFLCALMFLSGVAFAAIPEDYNVKTPENLETGHLYGTSCIVMDQSNGRILFEKNANERRYPASTTKIMTCIVALENGPMGEMVTIPNGVEPAYGSSKLGITPGEIMPFEDLVYGMMIASGNDASLAIAIIVSGTENGFVQLMNQKARDLGLTGTHFVNSHGLHTVNHYTTAHDLAIITRYAMANETFRDIVSTVTYDMQPTNMHPNGRTLTTKYDLLIEDKALYYEPCVGVKTGYTNAAGRCFVGAGEMGGHTLISVTLGTDPEDDLYIQAFTDTHRLLKYGFLQYENLTFSELYQMLDDAMTSFKVEKAALDDPNGGYLRMSVADIPDTYTESFMKADLEDPSFVTKLTKDFSSRISVNFSGPLTAPISKGDVLGKVMFETASGEVLTGSLVASRNVEMKQPTMDEVLDEWISESAPWMFKLMPRHNPPVRILYWLIVIGVIVLIVWRVRVKRRRERERMERIRREMLRKKKIAMQRAAQLKRAQAQGSATVKKTPQAAAAKHAAKPAVQAKRPAPKAADNAPIRKVRK
ncbi:MAG: D-alanyl-D-alanine carboxypeptidase [Clostridia bacterium]|nr:D-alanyl-D-alanine carboxypeptidase [Clostridia bacterium]